MYEHQIVDRAEGLEATCRRPADRDEAAKELESSATPTELKEREEAFDVPAGAVGVVRLTWKGDRARPDKDLSADALDGRGRPRPESAAFVIRTVFVGPVDRQAGGRRRRIYAGDLPKTPVYIPCCSSTRSEFPLEVRQLHPADVTGESNPLSVGDPVAMTQEELAKMLPQLQKQRASEPSCRAT